MKVKQFQDFSKNQVRLIFIIISLFLLVVLSITSLRFGGVKLTSSEVYKALFEKQDTIAKNIVLNLRMPRLLLSLIVGANLGIAGSLMQAATKNPLVDPGIIGVSSGAALIAVIVLLILPNYVVILPFLAFLGAMFGTFLVFSLSWKEGLNPLRLILAGVAVNSIFGAAISLITVLNSDKIQSALFWLNGSFSAKSWVHVKMIYPYSIPVILSSLFVLDVANVLQLGDDTAINLGYNVSLCRFTVSVISAFLTGISVSAVGIIGFVGLIVPHISRMIIGSDYKFLIPFSALMGALLLTLADTLSRLIFSPLEVPVGITMSILGGPFFLYLLKRKGGRRSHHD
ncbi:FecCD family ABC transporter permease [Fervidobacterium sp.]